MQESAKLNKPLALSLFRTRKNKFVGYFIFVYFMCDLCIEHSMVLKELKFWHTKATLCRITSLVIVLVVTIKEYVR